MARKIKKQTNERMKSRVRRHQRIRNKVSGDGERPRLFVLRSNKHVTAQLIDDVAGKTLTSLTTPSKSTANRGSAEELGKSIASKAQQLGIKKVVFDRGGYIYHGRVAAVAKGAREGGLSF